MGRFPDDRVLQAGGLTLDTQNRLATNGEKRIWLNPQECRLLSVFMQHPGEVLPRAFLMQAAWDWRISNPNDARTLEVHVCWLRKKLEDDPRNPRFIRTVRGEGYQFGG